MNKELEKLMNKELRDRVETIIDFNSKTKKMIGNPIWYLEPAINNDEKIEKDKKKYLSFIEHIVNCIEDKIDKLMWDLANEIYEEILDRIKENHNGVSYEYEDNGIIMEGKLYKLCEEITRSKFDGNDLLLEFNESSYLAHNDMNDYIKMYGGDLEETILVDFVIRYVQPKVNKWLYDNQKQDNNQKRKTGQ
ncbi:MAG: hypothetical protein ACRCUM_03175 [Mycoplasmoidaceae bacterium]